MSLMKSILELVGWVLAGGCMIILIVLCAAFALITPAAMVTLILWLTGVI